MKPYKDYHPPQGWVEFRTLKPSATFHDVIDGRTVKFVKVKYDAGHLAVNLQTGEITEFEADEFVYPVDAGWVAELRNYMGGVGIPKELEDEGPVAVLTHVFNHCDARKVDDAWRAELTRYVPSLGFMSFVGAKRVVDWVMERLGVKPSNESSMDKK